jgi:hypothetical protein
VKFETSTGSCVSIGWFSSPRSFIHQFLFFYPHLVDVPLPAYVVEHMDADVKNVLFDIHERAIIKRTSMVAARDKVNEPKPTTAQAEHATVTEDASLERGSFYTFLSQKTHHQSTMFRF